LSGFLNLGQTAQTRLRTRTDRGAAFFILTADKGAFRRILAKYAAYYNEVRTHVSLKKDARCRRPIERFGDIVAYPILVDCTIGTLESSIRKRQAWMLSVTLIAAPACHSLKHSLVATG
jgi:hypothetical protein